MSQRELDLERALADLAASLEFPPTPDLAAAVTARLEQAPAPAPARRRWWPAGLAGWRRLAVAGLAAVLLAAAVLVASPGTREAVARRLGLRGIGVQIGGPPPPTATTTPGARLDLGLGQRVTLEEARGRVDFPVLVPTAPGFQQADAGVPQEGGRDGRGRGGHGGRRARLLVQRRAPLLHLRRRPRRLPRGADPPGRQHPHLATRRPDPAPGGPAAQGRGDPDRRVDALSGVPAEGPAGTLPP